MTRAVVFGLEELIPLTQKSLRKHPIGGEPLGWAHYRAANSPLSETHLHALREDTQGCLWLGSPKIRHHFLKERGYVLPGYTIFSLRA